MTHRIQKAEKYTWCVIDESGRLYVAYSEIDAYMVQGTVGGTIYRRGCDYSGGINGLGKLRNL